MSNITLNSSSSTPAKLIQKRFYHAILMPAIELVATMVKDPLSIESISNYLLERFKQIVVAVNHFAETNGITDQCDDELSDLANSIKHIRWDPSKQVSASWNVMYEMSNDQFRFIRNTIIGKYDNSDREFDALEKICSIIAKYNQVVGLSGAATLFPTLESNYPFYEYAILYSAKGLAIETRQNQVIFLIKKGDQYIKSRPLGEARIMWLDNSAIDQDPTPYFLAPKVPRLKFT